VRNRIRKGPEDEAAMKVTVCQMPDDRDAFEHVWEGLARHVRRESSDLVLLPEMIFYHWFCAFREFDPSVWKEAVAEHSRWLERLPELGARAVIGSRPVDMGGRRLNQGFVWTRKGRTRGVHYKGYLPDEEGYYEASWYSRGPRRFSPFEELGWKMGFLICSDLWSMADARLYGKSGVDLVAVPRTTGEQSLDKWLSGGKVAGVLAGAYCASSNRSGARVAARFGGRGWVVDPDGEVLAMTSKGRPFATVEVDWGKAERAKGTYPRDSFEPG
jgi:N-carbamoylputrescine amidase